MFNDYSVNLPYPCIEGDICQKELDLLYDLAFGRFSKMTAFATYLYQSVIFSQHCSLYRLLVGIYHCELNHLAMLMNAILKFGGDPVFAGKHNYFSGSYANYQKNLKTALYEDLFYKRQTINQYCQIIDQTQNQSLADFLTRLKLDEQLHAKLLGEEIADIFGENQEDFLP